MDWIGRRETLQSVFRKYRWAGVVVIAGMILMALPSGKKEDVPQVPVPAENLTETDSLEQRLEKILSSLDGAGKVRVLLSIAEGSEYIYQTDDEEDQTGDARSRRRETVIITSAGREERGLLQRTDPPLYRGAVVLCQGADSAGIRLAMVEAVATATGLGSDKISVLKMK